MFWHLIALFTRTCVRVAQVKLVTCCILARRLKSHPIMFHKTLLDTLDTFSSFCSSSPQMTPDSLLLTGIRRTSCATPLAGMQFGHLAESSPHTQSTVTFSGAAVLHMWQHKTVLNRQKQFEPSVACFGWPSLREQLGARVRAAQDGFTNLSD